MTPPPPSGGGGGGALPTALGGGGSGGGGALPTALGGGGGGVGGGEAVSSSHRSPITSALDARNDGNARAMLGSTAIFFANKIQKSSDVTQR